MSKIWPHFSAEFPCPACGDIGTWTCRYGNDWYVCMRSESDRPNRDGGWLHKFGDTVVKPVKQWKPAPIKRDITKLTFTSSALPVIELSEKIGVTYGSLKALGVVWSEEYQATMWPMSDGDGNIIGYNRRFADGSKKVLPGTNAGLYVPSGVNVDTCCYIVEGGSDTAATLSLGLYGVGRFNCVSGANFLKSLLKRLHVRRIVIVADNDETKEDGRNPGIDGAKKLKRELPIQSVIWIPPSPIKDMREFLQKGGTKQMIESRINQDVWKVGL